MVLAETFTLSNGLAIPKLGLGTWLIDNDDAAQVVREAVNIGYRHFDTAQAYGNEAAVGNGVRSSGVKREHVFVTTKLAAEIKNYDEAVAAIDGSLATADFDYFDMMIIHSPQPWGEFRGEDRHLEGNREAWRALEDAYNAGKLRAIGLSNFDVVDIDNILSACNVTPMVNQVLVHISNTPTDVIAHSQRNGMLVEAYSPIGHGELLRNEHLLDIAKRYRVTVPQLSIRYVLQLGLVALPKTANAEHMRTNADVDFEISDDDMEVLQNMRRIEGYGDASSFPVFAQR